jgi:SAM-dependent methyltransferase
MSTTRIHTSDTAHTTPVDPSGMEVFLTRLFGTLGSSVYRDYVRRLGLKGNERVLDFGSGSGVCSRHLAQALQRGGYLTCVDISPVWVRVCQRTLRRYSNVDYHLGPVDTLPIPDHGYDAVFIHFVLHDIPAADRPAIMRCLAAKPANGGRVFVREPYGPEGIAVDELRVLMTSAGLRESTCALTTVPLMGPTYEGVFTVA